MKFLAVRKFLELLVKFLTVRKLLAANLKLLMKFPDKFLPVLKFPKRILKFVSMGVGADLTKVVGTVEVTS